MTAECGYLLLLFSVLHFVLLLSESDELVSFGVSVLKHLLALFLGFVHNLAGFFLSLD